MKSTLAKGFWGLLWIVGAVACAYLPTPGLSAAQQPAAKVYPHAATVPPAATGQNFDTPQHAARALVEAAANFDVAALVQIFGTDGADIVLTGETPVDRQRAADFAAEANEKITVPVDPTDRNRAFVVVGKEDWPFPVPIVKRGGTWSFDVPAGRRELLYRRIGANELDAITICHGYVQAQYQYAYQKREGYQAHQYAQRLISTPGTQDGLAWQNPNGTWGGPVGRVSLPADLLPARWLLRRGVFLSFGIGVAMGAAWSGGWCCGAGWGGNNNININNENNFVRNSNRERGNAGNRTGGGRSNWQHNPQHRGGAPYSNRKTADKYGGRTRGEQPGVSNRAGQGAQTRPGGGGASSGAQTRPGGGGASSGAQTRPGGGRADSADRVGGQDVSRGGGGGRDAFEGGKGGYNGRNAGKSSNRGSSSMGGKGGGSRGGTTRRSGGGGRGGGGRR